jgi:3-methyladenine DNA glycosylase AlkD
MTAAEIIDELKSLGSANIKKVLLNHGAVEPVLGVKIEDLKKIQKRVKMDYQLALELYDTGIYDAMYLAGLVADDLKMTKKDLQHWVNNATSQSLCNYTVAWVAAESRHGWELGCKWIDSKKENVAVCGWGTLSCLVGIKPDDELDLLVLQRLLERIERGVSKEPNRVRYTMIGFVIAVGSYVLPLSDSALQTAKRIGRLGVDVGDTSCKVPYAPDYIEKVRQRGAIGKKRKTAKC